MFSLRRKLRYRALTRLHSSNITLASRDIRDSFIKYFVNEHGHDFVRSCPIKPISDPTIPFVNAGMVQFKSVFLGKNLPPAQRVANSQKCARIGGKHNDLDTVGLDGYHHTFFEMLGNWSFGECNKQEACEMAWNLLTGPYGLNRDRLYVTYFGGDTDMKLEPDVETKEIWMKLGVKASHILPFGVEDNFWEMGLVGPCGPCTEIHIDHVPQRIDAGERVNAGYSDLTELWNIVFVQYHRDHAGKLNTLNQSHVDTGMGFERLVAVLNGAKSNYDTDLFRPILDAIHKISGIAPYSGSFNQSDDTFIKDQAYRIVCDHSRLLTVAISDGVVPYHECKLRWVLRRALDTCSNILMKDENLLIELTNFVAESLHCSYPEVGKNLAKVQRIIKDEASIYKSLRNEFPKNWLTLVKSNPEVESLLVYGSNREALASAFKKVKLSKTPNVTPELAFHLYESHGMSTELMKRIADMTGKTFNVDDYEKERERVRNESRMQSASGITMQGLEARISSANIPKTLDNFKYEYDLHDGQYRFPQVVAKVVGLVLEGELKSSVKGGTDCGLILDRTNFYHTAGGQASDQGGIWIADRKGHSFDVTEVIRVGDHVIHFGNVNGTIKVGDEVVLKVDETRRTACMRNHSLAHLINAGIQHLFSAPLQEKCLVQPSYLKLTYYLHGEDFTIEDAKKLEDLISYTIDGGLPVDRYSVDTWQVPSSTTLVPDETYPVDNIHIIDIKRGKKIVSREACCGTHVLNTKHVGKFCLVEVMKSKKTSICAVTGPEAEEAIAYSMTLTHDINKLSQNLRDAEVIMLNFTEQVADLPRVPSLKSHIDTLIKVHKEYLDANNFMKEKSRRLAYITYSAAANCLDTVSEKLNSMARVLSELEVKRKSQDTSCLAHTLSLSCLLQSPALGKFTRLVNIPILLMCPGENEVKIRCCIPEDKVSSDFNALRWMEETVAKMVPSDQDATVITFKNEGHSSSTQSRSVVFKNRVSAHARKVRCKEALKTAQKFATTHLKLKQKTSVSAIK